MSPTLLRIVLYLIEAAKENQTGPVVCHWCNNRVNIIKYGKYQRYGFTSDEMIDIQRYLCKHDQCRRTFSILPHPFLRISRFSLCLFNELLRLVDEHHANCPNCTPFCRELANNPPRHQDGASHCELDPARGQNATGLDTPSLHASLAVLV